MKIRKLTPETYPKVSALLLQAFSPNKYEVQLFAKLHEKKRDLLEWACIHRDTVIAYIAFSKRGLWAAPGYVGSEATNARRRNRVRVNPLFPQTGCHKGKYDLCYGKT